MENKQTFNVYWHNLPNKLSQIDVITETHKGAIAIVESELIMTQEDFKKPLLVCIKGGKVGD